MALSSLELPSPNLTDRLITLREDIAREAQTILAQYGTDTACPTESKSAKNLAHYLALRRHDLRPIQEELAEAGISSLGRCEAHVMHTLHRVVTLLQRGYSPAAPAITELSGGPTYHDGRNVLSQNSEILFGPQDHGRSTRIMVTLPSEAADDEQLVRDLLSGGMNCARINCAHDDRDRWHAMVKNIIEARHHTGRPCTILMDLAGHKIRTRLEPQSPTRLKLRPIDQNGGTETANVLLYPDNLSVRKMHIPAVAVPHKMFTEIRAGDRFRIRTANGKTRRIHLVQPDAEGNWLGRCRKKVTIDLASLVDWQRRDADGRFQTIDAFSFSGFAAEPEELRLYVHDRLLLTRGEAESPNLDGTNSIGCSHPEIVDALEPNQWVWFDDGKLGAIVDVVDHRGAWLHVAHSRPNGVKLRSDKGINLPETSLKLPCLTAKDLDDLDFICRHADMVGFSFVQSAEDMLVLMNELHKRDATHLAIIAKIETRVAVKNLPAIIFSTLGKHPLGIMIARGDLAVELGGVRMAEIQEELLWLCEAAHVPVVWATQVLEGLAKKGVSTRPELTDAAMSGRAECVMLNKGPHILEAVSMLNSILIRMQDHQQKKSSRLRALHW